jgi:hypothetical protein
VELGKSVTGSIAADVQVQRYCLSVSTDEIFGASVRTPELSFILTNLFGDADLYLSLSPRVPTMGDADFFSNRYALEDTLVITPSELRAALETEGPLPEAVLFNVLVQSYTAASFIFVTAVPHLTLQLENGQPQRDVGRAGDYQYYSFNLEGLVTDHASTAFEHDLVISVTSLVGDPQMYVSAENHHPNATLSTHEWASTEINGDDFVVIDAEELVAAAHRTGEDAQIWISVFDIQSSVYTIVASYDAVVRLIPGTPQRGAVASHSNRYYEFEVDGRNQDITITVFPSTGDVDLYVVACPASDSNCATSFVDDPNYSFEWSSRCVLLLPTRRWGARLLLNCCGCVCAFWVCVLGVCFVDVYALSPALGCLLFWQYACFVLGSLIFLCVCCLSSPSYSLSLSPPPSLPLPPTSVVCRHVLHRAVLRSEQVVGEEIVTIRHDDANGLSVPGKYMIRVNAPTFASSFQMLVQSDIIPTTVTLPFLPNLSYHHV